MKVKIYGAMAKKKRSPMKRRAILKNIGILGVLGFAVYVVFFSQLFRLNEVNFHGNAVLAPDSLKAVTADLMGKNLFTVSLSRLKNTLVSTPMVKDVILKRKLFHELECYIFERKPVAYVSLERLVGVDEDGKVFPEVEDSGDLDLPIITGLNGRELESSTVSTRLKGALEVLSLFKQFQFSPELSVSEIHVENNDIVMILSDSGVVVRFGDGDFLKEMRKFKAIYSVLNKEDGLPPLIDLRFDGQVVIRERS